MKRTAWLRKPSQTVKTAPSKRVKLPKLSLLKRKADALLQQLNSKLNKNCESCGMPCQVGHHWIEKSRCNYLRYNLEENIIPLCNSCHSKIHNIFGNSVVGGVDVAMLIINKRGQEWKNKMDKLQPTYQKVDRFYYESTILRLEKDLFT